MTKTLPTPHEARRIRKLYASGYSIRAISKIFPRLGYRQIQYYAASASIFQRSEDVKIAALREGAKT